MKLNKIVDRIERALWNAGRSSEPFAGSSDWQDSVMAAIRRIGPLETALPVRVYEPANAWSWAAAVAACIAIVIAGYALSGMNTDAVMAGLFWDDPAGLTVNTMLVEM